MLVRVLTFILSSLDARDGAASAVVTCGEKQCLQCNNLKYFCLIFIAMRSQRHIRYRTSN